MVEGGGARWVGALGWTSPDIGVGAAGHGRDERLVPPGRTPSQTGKSDGPAGRGRLAKRKFSLPCPPLARDPITRGQGAVNWKGTEAT